MPITKVMGLKTTQFEVFKNFICFTCSLHVHDCVIISYCLHGSITVLFFRRFGILPSLHKFIF